MLGSFSNGTLVRTDPHFLPETLTFCESWNYEIYVSFPKQNSSFLATVESQTTL